MDTKQADHPNVTYVWSALRAEIRRKQAADTAAAVEMARGYGRLSVEAESWGGAVELAVARFEAARLWHVAVSVLSGGTATVTCRTSCSLADALGRALRKAEKMEGWSDDPHELAAPEPGEGRLTVDGPLPTPRHPCDGLEQRFDDTAPGPRVTREELDWELDEYMGRAESTPGSGLAGGRGLCP